MSKALESEISTRKHAARVTHYLRAMVVELLRRSEEHDASKLETPEVEVLAKQTEKLGGLTYGSDEYKVQLKTVDMKPFLDHHYANNRHPPEHHVICSEWRDIPGYEGHYQVSDFGELRSLDRVVARPNKEDNVTKKGKVLIPHVTPKDYLRIQLSKDGVHKNHLVHRLVASAFSLSGDVTQQINHKNGDKWDNRISNLEWTTQSENMRHAYDNGLKSSTVKYVVHCVEKDITTFGIDKMVSALKKCGHEANSGGIWKCLNGKYKQHAGFTFTSMNIEEYNPHFPNGIRDMTLLDLVEMLCDWKAASERHQDGNIRKSIEHNAGRFDIPPVLAGILENTVKEVFGA